MTALAFNIFFIIAGLIISAILFIISIFVGHIILFDSIFISLIGGIFCNKMWHIHPAICLIIGIVLFIFLFWLQHTKFGFWIIGGLLSLFWAFVFGMTVYIFTDDKIWFYVILTLSFIVMMLLHIKARFAHEGFSNITHEEPFEKAYYGYNDSESNIYNDWKNKYEDNTAHAHSAGDFFAGVSSGEELKKRYKNLIKIYHPDNQAGDTTVSQQIHEEYEELIKQYE